MLAEKPQVGKVRTTSGYNKDHIPAKDVATYATFCLFWIQNEYRED